MLIQMLYVATLIYFTEISAKSNWAVLFQELFYIFFLFLSREFTLNPSDEVWGTYFFLYFIGNTSLIFFIFFEIINSKQNPETLKPKNKPKKIIKKNVCFNQKINIKPIIKRKTIIKKRKTIVNNRETIFRIRVPITNNKKRKSVMVGKPRKSIVNQLLKAKNRRSIVKKRKISKKSIFFKPLVLD
jgi:hypothetical protein